MRQEAGLVKSIAKEIVFGGQKPAILKNLRSADINDSRLKDLLTYHELGPFLYVILKNNLALAPRNLFLKEAFYSQLIIYMSLWNEFLRIIREAQKQNILILPIKGLSFSENLYKRFGFRPLVDIDLLIKEGQLEAGISFLEGLDYRKHLIGEESYWRKEQCHLSFINSSGRQPFLVELHWALDFKRGKKEILPSLWKRIKQVEFDKTSVPTLSPEDTLLSLALHQRRFGKMLNLKYVLDTGLIIKTHQLDWDYLFKTSRAERMQASLFFLLYQTSFVLDMDLKNYLDGLKISFPHKSLIERIIKKYTYLTYQEFNLKYLYLLCHLLLYDSFREPLKYIFNIPEEQFARFYQLPLYEYKTKIAYRWRAFYIPFRTTCDYLERLFKDKIG